MSDCEQILPLQEKAQLVHNTKLHKGPPGYGCHLLCEQESQLIHNQRKSLETATPQIVLSHSLLFPIQILIASRYTDRILATLLTLPEAET